MWLSHTALDRVWQRSWNVWLKWYREVKYSLGDRVRPCWNRPVIAGLISTFYLLTFPSFLLLQVAPEELQKHCWKSNHLSCAHTHTPPSRHTQTHTNRHLRGGQRTMGNSQPAADILPSLHHLLHVTAFLFIVMFHGRLYLFPFAL